MKVWIAGVDGRRGWIIWRWSTETEEGAATVVGLGLPSTIVDAGSEAIATAIRALVKRIADDLLRPGWRIRRVFVEHESFREQMFNELAHTVMWMSSRQAERELLRLNP